MVQKRMVKEEKNKGARLRLAPNAHGIVLPHTFFARSAPRVAEELIGKYLVSSLQGKTPRAFRITETEAYDGMRDKASHASRGRTARTEVMFGDAGHFYVYLCYGMHYMLNVVTGARGYPGAVLIRGVEETAGPGRVTSMLGISASLNTKKAVPESGVWFEDCGVRVPRARLLRTPRIGVAYAEEWAKKKWRFVMN